MNDCMTCLAFPLRRILAGVQPPLLRHPLRGFGRITVQPETDDPLPRFLFGFENRAIVFPISAAINRFFSLSMRDKHLTRLKDTGVFAARESVVEPDKPSGKTGFSLVLKDRGGLRRLL
jgi:hypothetical protein